MIDSDIRDTFISLVRLGIGHSALFLPDRIDWESIQALAAKQGLLAVVTDCIGNIPIEKRPQKKVLLRWIGNVMRDETRYAVQQKTAAEMALLFHENGIRTYVLKGLVVAECYPRPEHRLSVDLDCFLLPENDSFDAWARGNELIQSNGYKVSVGFYKNSAFLLPTLRVENHRFLTPFRGNNVLKRMEIMLQNLLREDLRVDCDMSARRFSGTQLYRPPVMFSALFLIEHAYSHFLHEGMTWRLVLDWMLFSRRHKEAIDWKVFDARINEFGFRRFYESYVHIGRYLLGELDDTGLSIPDKLMLSDVWMDLDLHKDNRGIKGKLELVGNTWRARWKYKFFTEITMLHALWIQVKGLLFIKQPTLD